MIIIYLNKTKSEFEIIPIEAISSRVRRTSSVARQRQRQRQHEKQGSHDVYVVCDRSTTYRLYIALASL
jgi:hypothetical protein